MLPYLRDTRRSHYGLDGFRLMYPDLNYSNPEDGGKTARHFYDTVGIGSYLYADIHHLEESACPPSGYPAYLLSSGNAMNPYYIPYRALTSNSSSNLLVCGKGMAQTFLANAGTRLHPTEWVSGVAAGAAAYLMVERDWGTTKKVLDHIIELQDLLRSESVSSPLEWTL
jgi:hypothetical protein